MPAPLAAATVRCILGAAALAAALLPQRHLCCGSRRSTAQSDVRLPVPPLCVQVTKYSLYYLYLGLAAFVVGYFQVAAWMLTGAGQVPSVCRGCTAVL